MKKLLGIIFLIFIFNSGSYANDMNDTFRACNSAVKILNYSYGYNFQNFSSTSLMTARGDSAMCGYPPNSNQLIYLMINPARIHVTDPGYGNLSGHCIYPASGKIKREKLSACRGW